MRNSSQFSRHTVLALALVSWACSNRSPEAPAKHQDPPPPMLYAVGGVVESLAAGESIVLRFNAAELTVTENGAFTFSEPIEEGATYTVGIATQPRTQQCSVLGASGIAEADVNSVNVTCFERIAVDAMALGRSVLLSWNQPPSTEYQLYWSVDPQCDIHAIASCQGGQTAAVVHSPHTVFELENGQHYTFWLKAQRSGGHTTVSQTGARPDRLITNGYIRALAVDDTTGAVYMGGSFKALGARSGGGVAFRTDAVGTYPSPLVQGWVRAVAADGQGGWYIGGTFTHVGGLARNHVAHILADGSVAPWNPQADAGIRAIVVKDELVYVGGEFTEIGGKARRCLAALDRATGLANDWDPAPVNIVAALALSNDTLYVGGGFTMIDDEQPRKHVAAFDLSTSQLTDWAPDINGAVRTLAVNSNALFVGGDFLSVNDSTPRSYLAAFELGSGGLLDWDPSANGFVYSLFADGDTVYAGGDFTQVNGQPRQSIAAIHAATGTATSWAPAMDAIVASITVGNGVVYASGYFSSVDDVHPRQRLAAIDAESGKPTAWAPQLSGPATALALHNDMLYVGGSFGIAHGAERNHLAAVDKDGYLRDWSPNADHIVRALALTDTLLYVGGQFTSIGYQSRLHLAALDLITGNTNSWNPSANGIVSAIAVSDDDKIYVGGAFSEMGNLQRWRMARFAAGDSTPDSWAPSFDAGVHSRSVNALVLDHANSVVFIGGRFDTFNGSSCKNVTLLSMTGVGQGAPTWCGKLDGSVDALAQGGSTLYVGGAFSLYDGMTSREGVAAFSITAGIPLLPWNPGANDSVNSLLVQGDTIYVGGRFTSIGGQQRNRIAALDTHGDAIEGWNPDLSGSWNINVHALAAHADTIYLGGIFSTLGGDIAHGFATVAQ